MADSSGKTIDESKAKVDSNSIRLLAELLNELNLSEIEIGEGATKIRVARVLTSRSYPNKTYAQVEVQNDTNALNAPNSPEEKTLTSSTEGAVVSPLVGVVYHAPEPGAEAFVKVGDLISEGDTLFIVEAMKTMNPIRSLRNGRVSEILVKNGTPVEYGEVLLILE